MDWKAPHIPMKCTKYADICCRLFHFNINESWKWTNTMHLYRYLLARMPILITWMYLPRSWPSVTDMQHYYHARYHADDWHLAYMFSLVYVSVEVCLEGVFPHSVNTRQDSWVRVYAPPPHAGSPLTKTTKSNRGWPTRHLNQARRHLNWRMGLPALLGDNLGCRIV